MKKGFTLIELLIVTVVIATLLGIVFRLAGLGGDSRARAITIRRMQCLENCLSGYYAAYGSYPPVPLQGRSRSIYSKVDVLNVQQRGTEEGSGLNVLQVDAACKAQPLAALFPFGRGQSSEAIQELSAACQYYHPKSSKYKVLFSNELEDNPGAINSRLGNPNWGSSADAEDANVQIFQFGLMSFLLPRFLFMLEGNEDFYDHSVNGKRTGQWADNNQLPCSLDNGQPYSDWATVGKYMGGRTKDGTSTYWQAGMISNLTSQCVCARWMPNLQGIVTGGRTFYGVDTYCSENDDYYMQVPGFTSDGIEYDELHVHSMNGYASGGGSSRYLLNCMTVRDGWHRDFFYYSDAPYQSYRLWSAGPNRKTFPPWYSLDKFNQSDISTIRSWTDDDVVHLSN